MVDELDGPGNQGDSDEENDDPEVPLRSTPGHTGTNNAEEHTSRSQTYIATAFEWAVQVAVPSAGRVLLSANFWTAAATVAIAVSTGIYTHYASKQWGAMNDTLSEIKKQTPLIQAQATAAQSQLELANRPWIKVVGVATHDAPGLISALSFRQIGPFDSQHRPVFWVNFIASVTIENMGPSVAVNTNITLMPLTPAVVRQDYGRDILATESAFCGNERKAQSEHNVTGVTIFPDDPYKREVTFGFTLDPKLVQRPKGFLNQAGYLALSVGGCITYQSAVSKKVYQTAFIYDVVGFDKGFNSFIGVIPLAANISAKDLRFDRNEAGYFAQ